MAITKLDITRQGQFSGDTAIGSHKLTGLLDPTLAQDAATKAYVDSAAAGILWKASVRAATTVTGTLATAYTNTSVIDGVTLVTGDRILIKDQATGAENGIYVVQVSGSPVRATDADTSAEVPDNMAVFVQEGTANADSAFTMTNNGVIVLGTTALVFTQFTGLGQITAGNVLTKTGNTIQVASMATGTAIIGNAGTPTVTAITGDVVFGATGVTAIGANKITLGMQATLAANTAIANATGSTATPTAVPMVTGATASAIAIRDTSANVKANNHIDNLATTATAVGTTTLTVGSARTQQFTGVTTQTVVLPDATTLSVGHSFIITNRSTGIVTVNANGGGLIQTMATGSQVTLTAVTIGVAAGTWDSAYSVVAAGATKTFTSCTVTGLINSSNTSFTLGVTPNPVGSEMIILNGLVQNPTSGDYTISGATVTYGTAPVTGDIIRAYASS